MVWTARGGTGRECQEVRDRKKEKGREEKERRNRKEEAGNEGQEVHRKVLTVRGR